MASFTNEIRVPPFPLTSAHLQQTIRFFLSDPGVTQPPLSGSTNNKNTYFYVSLSLHSP